MADIDRARLLESVPTELFIGGKWAPARSRATFEVVDPASEEILVRVADASSEDGIAALDAAVDAAAGWAATPPWKRADLLRAAYDAILARREEIATLITLEMGKPLAESRGEVDYGATFFRWFSESASRMHLEGAYGTEPGGGYKIMTYKRPVGPTLLVTPWNFPLAMGTRKIGAALAAGCTVVIKPAEQTPLTMLLFAEVMREAGLPDGVLNVITTSDAAGVVAPIMADPRLRKISFTGSTQVGKLLLGQAAEGVLRSSMELGGNSPLLVFDDADIDAAVDGATMAKMRNGGESCVAANRIYVQSGVLEEFTRKLAERLGSFRTGHGLEEGVTLGPLIDGEQRAKVVRLVDDAVDKGATVVMGGEVPSGAGHFYPPTVLRDVPRDAAMHDEEIFGPVAAIYSFDTEREAIERANDTPYGLASYLFTRDLSRAVRVAEALDTGMTGINRGVVSNPAAPFGGIKESGLGREGSSEGIEEYLETKYIGMQL
jgi:succinate-semialdehyde dehydrogenase / glutarate-semialdehyde dehydrogenase